MTVYELLLYNYQPEKGNKNCSIFNLGSYKITNWKKLCKSEQRELDAVYHTLSVMYMPFVDLRDGYGCSIDKQIWLKVFASMAQRPA